MKAETPGSVMRPICTPFQPHLTGDTISNYLSIDRDCYAGQIISLTE